MLEVAGVTKRFPVEGAPAFTALSDVEITVAEHEILSLVGASGCGKSTLLRILSGLDHPSAGRVAIDGRSVEGPTPEIAMVFQEPRLMPWMTVRENVRLALTGFERVEQERRIAEALHKVGLVEFAEALPRALSGGMAQRVAIARALVRQPQILLLDEPFSALDSFTRQKLQEHLLTLWRDASFTIVLVTHDIEEAVALSDRIVVMRPGPGRVHKEYAVELDQPRRRSAPAFQALKDEIIAALDLNDIGP